MKLSIIIVNYNVQYFLENCLNSVLLGLKNIQAEIIVVDNNSVDGSVKMLQEKFPEVTVIKNNINSGFSKANNQAIRIANGEFILLLNPDTVVREDTFEVCLNFFKNHDEAGGIGVKMLDGQGNFLPESKRGLPTPSVAFYKIFGLSQLFPKSKQFGQYHLGHLSNNEIHEIDILSGAFMMVRKNVFDQIGLLDENFFMYGEDIDISYRITLAGYKNFYLPDTSIIHYKGESTKKSSINYVFVFYRAMAVFARKHFSNQNAKLFSFLINLAIYIRASLAIITRAIKQILLPLTDATVLFIGVYAFKSYYEKSVKYIEGGSYPQEVELYGIPIIIGIYMINLWIAGAYNIPTKPSNIFKGVFSGSVSTLITYSLLDEEFRFSRAIIVFTVLFSILTLPFIRYLLNLTKVRKFKESKLQRIAIVGGQEEIERIDKLLELVQIEPEKIIRVNPGNNQDKNKGQFAGKLYQLSDLIEIYELNEIIFCAKDLSSEEIINQMSILKNHDVDFKIAPPKSLYIIGSNSVEYSGKFYLIGTDRFSLTTSQYNKRSLDIILSLIFIMLSPFFFWISLFKANYFQQLFKILIGKLSFVGFHTSVEDKDQTLKIKKGILSVVDSYPFQENDQNLIERLNIEYGKNYNILKDLNIIFRNLPKIGRPV